MSAGTAKEKEFFGIDHPTWAGIRSMDIMAGRARLDVYMLGARIDSKVEQTALSKLYRELVGPEPPPMWQPVAWWFGRYSVEYWYSSAASEARTLGEVLGEYKFTPDAKRRIITTFLGLLQEETDASVDKAVAYASAIRVLLVDRADNKDATIAMENLPRLEDIPATRDEVWLRAMERWHEQRQKRRSASGTQAPQVEGTAGEGETMEELGREPAKEQKDNAEQAQPALQQGQDETAADRLARTLVRIGTDDESFVALLQLRRLLRERAVTPDVLVPLWRVEGPYPCLVARALAAGGPAMETAALEQLAPGMTCITDGGAVPLGVLALVENPSAEVTRELVRRTGSLDAGSLEIGSYSLVLAARGDTSADWIGNFIAAVHSKGREVEERAGCLLWLCSLDGRVRTTPALDEALWEMITAEPALFEAPYALMAYACMDRLPIDAARAARLREAVASYEYWDWRPILHLALARLGVEPDEEMAAALGGFGDWLMPGGAPHAPMAIQHVTCLLMNNAMDGAIARALQADDGMPALAALYIVRFMGPDARAMLPEVERLCEVPYADMADVAKEAYRAIGGLNAEGDWALEPPGEAPTARETSSEEE